MSLFSLSMLYLILTFPQLAFCVNSFLPFSFPFCSLLLSLSVLPLAGPHFLSIVTLRAGYLKFQSYNAVLYVLVTRCNSEVPSLFF